MLSGSLVAGRFDTLEQLRGEPAQSSSHQSPFNSAAIVCRCEHVLKYKQLAIEPNTHAAAVCTTEGVHMRSWSHPKQTKEDYCSEARHAPCASEASAGAGAAARAPDAAARAAALRPQTPWSAGCRPGGPLGLHGRPSRVVSVC